MSHTKATRIVTVTNPEGVHARAALLIGELVRGFDAEVILRKKGHEDAKGTEILQMLSLGAGPGDQVSLEATGADAARVLDALEQLFTENFGENEENTEKATNQP